MRNIIAEIWHAMTARWSYLRRVPRSHGFGVQSPWAYGFVRNVLNERCPYYAYQDMRGRHPRLKRRVRKQCELYFRLANYCRASGALLQGLADADVYADYIVAGCRKTAIRMLTVPDAQSVSGTEQRVWHGETFVITALNDCGLSIYDSLTTAAADGTLMVAHGIRDDRESLRRWKTIAAGRAGQVTFDLYCCGIVFFDSKRYTKNYIVNF